MCHVQHARLPVRPNAAPPPSLSPRAINRQRNLTGRQRRRRPAQDEVSGRTITPNVGVSFVIRQSNIPGAKHCIDARPPPPTSPGQPRLFLSRMLRRSVVAAVAASLGPPASLPLALLSQPSPETPVKRIGIGWAVCQTRNSPHGNRYASIIAKSWGGARSIHHKWKWM